MQNAFWHPLTHNNCKERPALTPNLASVQATPNNHCNIHNEKNAKQMHRYLQG
jgi:hypothetical protein